jgi:WD40 repeat protein
MLITAGHLIVGNQIFDIDLAEPPISLWTDASVYPGSGPGVVWLARRRIGFNAADWVAQVDVESLTVGEQVTDVSFYPLVGVADGLIVHELSDDNIFFWSPTDGIDWAVDLPIGPGAFVAASGNLVVVVWPGSVNVLDIVSGENVASFELPQIVGPVTSACLSPDGQHVIVVGSNREAVVGNTTTGEVFGLTGVIESFGLGMTVQPKHGIGWTTDDQLVFIAGDGDTKHVFGFDISSGDGFAIAELHGPEEWWLTASGTMC